MANIVEGQIYEGPVSALGGEGPLRRWIVISPFSKTHAHSLGDPLDLHCMPLGILERLIADQRVCLVDVQPDHPIIRLQRAKEAKGLADTHLGLRDSLLSRALQFLDEAANARADYTRYLAGEVLALFPGSIYPDADVQAVHRRVFAAIEMRP